MIICVTIIFNINLCITIISEVLLSRSYKSQLEDYQRPVFNGKVAKDNGGAMALVRHDFTVIKEFLTEYQERMPTPVLKLLGVPEPVQNYPVVHSR